jgi:hypothetical protein
MTNPFPSRAESNPSRDPACKLARVRFIQTHVAVISERGEVIGRHHSSPLRGLVKLAVKDRHFGAQ